MSCESDFMQSIIQHPDDDSKRLAFADWLQSNGQERRAEFIRAQIRLHADEGLTAAETTRLKALVDAYIEADKPAMKAMFNKHDSVIGIVSYVYERGFVERYEGGLLYDEFTAENLRQAFALAPIRYFKDRNQLIDLGILREALPFNLKGLELTSVYVVEDDDLCAIISSEKLRSLEILHIMHDRNGAMINDAKLARALGSPHLSKLRILGVNVDYTWRGPSARILLAIAASPHLTNLQRLNLNNLGKTVDEEVVANLRESSNFANIVVLDVRGSELPRGVWNELGVWMASLPKLRKVFAADGIDTDLSSWISASPETRAYPVTELEVSGIDLFETGAELLRQHLAPAVVDSETSTEWCPWGDVYWPNRVCPGNSLFHGTEDQSEYFGGDLNVPPYAGEPLQCCD